MSDLPIVLFCLGLLLVLFLAIKALFTRFSLPPVVGYIALGWLLRQWGEDLPHELPILLSWLAKLGILLLLFHVGVRTNLNRIYSCLHQAGIIAFSNIALSVLLGYSLTFFWFGSVELSWFIGFALAATSIGVSTAMWGEKRLNKTKMGSILLDIVTLDDIIAVLMVAFLLHFSAIDFQVSAFLKLGAVFLLKIVGFLFLCYLFSHFIESKLVSGLIKFEHMPDTLLSMIGIGMLIAAFATYFHFSYVVGAFLAGIVFSRDPRAIRIDQSMQLLLNFFVPFFFLWIGFQISLGTILWGYFFVLLLIAILGKGLGTYLPARLVKIRPLPALSLSIAAIPRAEIAMVIAELGLGIGIVSESVFSTFTLVVLATCLLSPLLFRPVERVLT